MQTSKMNKVLFLLVITIFYNGLSYSEVDSTGTLGNLDELKIIRMKVDSIIKKKITFDLLWQESISIIDSYQIMKTKGMRKQSYKQLQEQIDEIYYTDSLQVVYKLGILNFKNKDSTIKYTRYIVELTYRYKNIIFQMNIDFCKFIDNKIIFLKAYSHKNQIPECTLD